MPKLRARVCRFSSVNSESSTTLPRTNTLTESLILHVEIQVDAMREEELLVVDSAVVLTEPAVPAILRLQHCQTERQSVSGIACFDCEAATHVRKCCSVRR